MRARTLGLMLVAMALGCGDDAPPAAEEGASTGSSTSAPSGGSVGPTTSGTSTGGPTSVTTDAADSSGTGFVPPESACGNGFVEAGEECDDANDDDQDGCTSACELRCGLDWTARVLAPTDTSIMDPRGVVTDVRGGAAVGGLVREITTDQRGNETILDDEGIVVRVSPDGETLWSTRIEVDGVDAAVTGISMDDAGNVYTSATVGSPEGDDDIRLYKLDNRGAIVWFSEFDSAVDTAEDLSFGVAMGSDGNPVITGQVRAGEGDNDVWVASYDADSGEEIWSSTWSGESSGGFSTDSGGRIAVGSDGTVYLFIGEYVDFQTRLVTLLSFDGAGGPATEVYTPQVGVGGAEFLPLDVSFEAGGTLLLTSRRLLPAADSYELARVEPDSGVVSLSWDAPFFEDALSLPDISGVSLLGAESLEGGGVIVSGQVQRSLEDAEWVETWVVRLDENDALDCVFVRESPQLSFIPGSLFSRDMAAAGSGRAVIAAQEVEDGAESIWIGAFRPD